MIITGGKYKGRKIIAPDETITRPTLSKVRMGVFNSLYSLLGDFEGKTFLDMFGGSGIIGLEALSRGFSEITVFEKNLKIAEIIKKNYKELNIVPNMYIGDSESLVKKISENFDVIYIDPPYESQIYERILNGKITLPLKEDALIIIEHSKDFQNSIYKLIKTKNYGGKKVSFFSNVIE